MYNVVNGEIKFSLKYYGQLKTEHSQPNRSAVYNEYAEKVGDRTEICETEMSHEWSMKNNG